MYTRQTKKQDLSMSCMKMKMHQSVKHWVDAYNKLCECVQQAQADATVVKHLLFAPLTAAN